MNLRDFGLLKMSVAHRDTKCHISFADCFFSFGRLRCIRPSISSSADVTAYGSDPSGCPEGSGGLKLNL
jgi:hypothetical protein